LPLTSTVVSLTTGKIYIRKYPYVNKRHTVPKHHGSRLSMSYFYVSRTECSIDEYHNVNVVLYTSLGGVVVPPGEMLVHRRLTPQNYVFETHYTPGQRKKVWSKINLSKALPRLKRIRSRASKHCQTEDKPSKKYRKETYMPKEQRI